MVEFPIPDPESETHPLLPGVDVSAGFSYIPDELYPPTNICTRQCDRNP